MELKEIKEHDLGAMKVHEVLDHHLPPYFRVMRVPYGWLYNFYDSVTDNYSPDWILVPEKY